jgi:hypothetical protein
MTIDFAEITIYELLALILAGIAIIIPIIQWAWKKWMVRPVLLHLPTGRAFLFINRSGSYMQIEGVFQAEKKSITIKNMALKVVRAKDDKALNLTWSTFTSPVNQRVGGNYTSVTETAHPFCIAADSVACAFTEFADIYNSAGKAIQPFYEELSREAARVSLLNKPYDEVYSKYIACNVYNSAKEAMKKEFFWEIGQYNAILEVKYEKASKCFNYEFSVTPEDYNRLQQNLNMTLLCPLKDQYMMPYNMQTVQVEIKGKTL